MEQVLWYAVKKQAGEGETSAKIIFSHIIFHFFGRLVKIQVSEVNVLSLMTQQSLFSTGGQSNWNR